MIHFCFDNNALQALFANDRYDEILAAVTRLRQTESARFHFSFYNFCERILGIGHGHFEEIRDYLRNSNRLTQGQLLLRHSFHIGSTTGSFPFLITMDKERVLLELQNWVDFLNDLDKCSNEQEAIALAEPLQKLILEDKTASFSGFESIRGAMQSFKNEARFKNKSAVFCSSEEDRLNLRANLFLKKLSSLNLLQIHSELGDEEIANLTTVCVSIIYQADVYISYFQEVFSSQLKPDKGDWLDFEYIIYLDRCDYLVTNDRRFRGIIGRAGITELNDRLISTDEFCKSVIGPTFALAKRAPLRDLSYMRLSESEEK